MPWDYRRYGTSADPVHKSHLNDITGDYGCPTRFRYQMDERHAAGGVVWDAARPVRGDAACGTAAHETIARALISPLVAPKLLRGEGIPREHVRRVLEAEFEREVGGRRVEWYERDPDQTLNDRVDMVTGVLGDIHHHVSDIVLVEPAFIVQLNGYWLSGHIDLIYRPRGNPAGIGLADWKTGAMRPSSLILDHGWEAGVYATAVAQGWFLDREHLTAQREGNGPWCVHFNRTHEVTHPSKYIAERECAERVLSTFASVLECRGNSAVTAALHRLGLGFPTEIYHVHLTDYVPYRRGGRKEVRRAEDLRHYGHTGPAVVKYAAGERRGPAWLPVSLAQHDITRVAHRLRAVVGMVRMGRFIDQIGDRCARCPYAGDCLTGGYAVRGDERRVVERALTAEDGVVAAELVLDD